MVNLQSYYLSHKADLSQALSNSVSPQELFRKVELFFADLTDVNGEYVRSLTPSQARLALTVLGSLRNVFATIAESFAQLGKIGIEREVVGDSDHSQRAFRMPSVDALTGIGTAAVIGGFFPNPALGIPLAIGAGLGAAAAMNMLAPSERLQTGQADAAMREEAAPDMPAVKQAISLDFLEESLKAVDTLVANHGRLEKAARPIEVPARIEDHPAVLAFFQDLLGWYARKQSDLHDESFYPLRLRLEETLPDLLSLYGIRIRNYDPSASGMDAAMFDFEEEVGSRKLQTPQAVQPALVRDDEVITKGRVICPKGS